MQKDEEVGKVAQATPIVICEFPCPAAPGRAARVAPQPPSNSDVFRAAKALELFLAMIIDEASKVTLDRGSKRVEAYQL